MTVRLMNSRSNKLKVCRILPFFLSRLNLEHERWCCRNIDPNASLDHALFRHDFSLKLLAWAIQNNANLNTVERYLKYFSQARIEQEFSTELTATDGGRGFPILYFAVERNSPELVRLLCRAGAQPSQRMRPSGIPIVKLPLLAYAILSAEYRLVDTTDTVIALLAMGASPGDVPRDMWENYVKAPTKDVPVPMDAKTGEDLWCTSVLREAICRNLNLMQRYALWKADGTEQQTKRMRQIVTALNIQPLLETIYYIIGQRSATQQVVQRIVDYIMYGDGEATPLVLLFTGPSGHGKTELARRMGELLSLKMHTVDCTEMKQETDMFGPKKPYDGYEQGTPLNNFLWENAGERCVVFLDEVEKMGVEVRNAMLKLFESGMFKDRRDDKPANCSKVIWVLAANLGCEIIQNFWVHHLKDRTEEQQRKVSFASFERILKESIIRNLGAPFTGRLTAIVPFMPFNAGEQAVATYKFMRDLSNKARKPIDTAAKHFPRHIFLNYNDDGSIAAHIAKANYSTETGARTLQHAVNREIRGRLSHAFLAQEEMVKDEMNEGPWQNYEVRLVRVEKDVNEVSVELRGTRQIQLPSQKPTEGEPAKEE